MVKNDSVVADVLISLLYFLLGIVFVAATEELIKTFNYVLVCISAILGVIQLIQFFLGRKYRDKNYIDLFLGIVFIWVSLILYVYYGFMINILPILFSLYLFMMAAWMLIKYVEIKRSLRVKKYRYLVLSGIALVIGVLLIFNPGSMIFLYLKVTGIYLIMVAILEVFVLVRSVKG